MKRKENTGIKMLCLLFLPFSSPVLVVTTQDCLSSFNSKIQKIDHPPPSSTSVRHHHHLASKKDVFRHSTRIHKINRNHHQETSTNHQHSSSITRHLIKAMLGLTLQDPNPSEPLLHRQKAGSGSVWDYPFVHRKIHRNTVCLQVYSQEKTDL